jgi:shikimate kinase
MGYQRKAVFPFCGDPDAFNGVEEARYLIMDQYHKIPKILTSDVNIKHRLNPGENPMKNIVIIGMPGAGKSTLGVILAKTLGRNFIDTDIVAQENTGRLLQEIIDDEGTEAFLKTEERTILSLQYRNTVIATGGSVVFSEKAMEHLKKDGIIVYLKISFEEMVRRLNNITTRGIVLVAGQSLREMYDQRVPLYEKYSDITIDCSDGDFENCIGNVIDELHTFSE